MGFDEDDSWETGPIIPSRTLASTSASSFQPPGDDEWDSEVPSTSRAPLKQNNDSKSFGDISKRNKGRHVTGDDCPIQFDLPKREPIANDDWEEEEPVRNSSSTFNNQNGMRGRGFSINNNGRGRGRRTQFEDNDELNDVDNHGLNNRGMNRGRGGGGGRRGMRGNRSRGGGETRGRGSQRTINRNTIGAEIHGGEPREPYVPPEINDSEELLKERLSKYATVQPNYEPFESKEIQVSDSDYVECYDSFESMGLKNILLENIEKALFDMPMPIQTYGSPVLLKERDLMACAQTGSGKTGAFLIPIINKLLEMEDRNELSRDGKTPEAVILAPTRELVIQINNEAKLYSRNTQVHCRAVYGGTFIPSQRNALATGCNILVATPGRLDQFIVEKVVDLSKVKYFILDEADRMLDMGFSDIVNKIAQALPPKDQRTSAMFSATLPVAIQLLATTILHNVVFIVIGTISTPCTEVEQDVFEVPREQKRDKLMSILKSAKPNDKILVFCATRIGTDMLALFLSDKEVSSTSIHGQRFQKQREIAISEFEAGKRKVLVATDVAARGLDIPKVTMVINYDLPRNYRKITEPVAVEDGELPAETEKLLAYDEYIHRIGRTGRVGNPGRAISFYDPQFDKELAPYLVRALQGSNKTVPEWLLNELLPVPNVFDDNANADEGIDTVDAEKISIQNKQKAKAQTEDDDWED